jgi:hypothetical protein
MSFNSDNAQILLDVGSFGFTEAISFRVLEFSYGDGYEDSALIGSTDGTRSWKLTYKVLPGFRGQTQGGVFSAQSRADYLWNFFCDRMAAGNESFKFISPKDGRLYLAAFAETTLSYELFMTKLFTTGISVKQRREKGVWEQ